MNAITAELVEDGAFFAPVQYGMLETLLVGYDRMRAKIDQVADLFEGDIGSVVHYFVTGNQGDRGGYSSLSAERIFRREGAIAALNADYWNRAMAMTDVYELMPEKRREEWSNAIREHTTPEFTEANVRPTMESLLHSRAQFFAERVDGVFRALSHTHVTNQPEGFQKRSILSYVVEQFGGINYHKAGYVNDLRCIIARFMGRDEPKRDSTRRILEGLRSSSGKWHVLDGGALRVRLYTGVGTLHVEVNPEIAWRLNATLHSLYPSAIPHGQRTKPAKAPKAFALMQTPLPTAVIAILEEGHFNKEGTYMHFRGDRSDKATMTQACSVLEALGGSVDTWGVGFDYDARDVVTEVIISGCIPEQKSHQFYPTPDTLAQLVVDLAEIEDDSRCLEPSAGQGAIADRMPREQTTCVEIAPLQSAILQKKGHNVVTADFLQWAITAASYDRICMNPPYADRRASLHVRAASGLVSPGGRIVAVLPASMHGDTLNPGWDESWTPVYRDAFKGTGVAVAIYAATRPR